MILSPGFSRADENAPDVPEIGTLVRSKSLISGRTVSEALPLW